MRATEFLARVAGLGSSSPVFRCTPVIGDNNAFQNADKSQRRAALDQVLRPPFKLLCEVGIVPTVNSGRGRLRTTALMDCGRRLSAVAPLSFVDKPKINNGVRPAFRLAYSV